METTIRGYIGYSIGVHNRDNGKVSGNYYSGFHIGTFPTLDPIHQFCTDPKP